MDSKLQCKSGVLSLVNKDTPKNNRRNSWSTGLAVHAGLAWCNLHPKQQGAARFDLPGPAVFHVATPQLGVASPGVGRQVQRHHGVSLQRLSHDFQTPNLIWNLHQSHWSDSLAVTSCECVLAVVVLEHVNHCFDIINQTINLQSIGNLEPKPQIGAKIGIAGDPCCNFLESRRCVLLRFADVHTTRGSLSSFVTPLMVVMLMGILVVDGGWWWFRWWLVMRVDDDCSWWWMMIRSWWCLVMLIRKMIKSWWWLVVEWLVVDGGRWWMID